MTLSNETIFIIVAISAMVAISMWIQKCRDAGIRRLAEEYMGGRLQRSSAEFGRIFYPDNADIAARIRDIFAKHIPLNIDRLEPSDRPVIDLKMDDLDSMSAAEFIIALEKEYGIKIANADAERMRTFDDICSHVISKLKEKNVDNKAFHLTRQSAPPA